MPEQTLEAPSVHVPLAQSAGARGEHTRSLLHLARRHPWLPAAAGVLLLSLVIVLWTRVRPGYDPYGWLVWGKLTLHLKLDTNGAPSWKPLTFLFTVPFALFGRYQLWLWMITSVAVSLAGPIFAWRIAFRLTKSDPARRYASYLAGATAAVVVLLMHDPLGYTYTHYVLSAESDTMIVALCLAAIDFHLSGRHKVAFWFWWLGSLGRPEVWPFAGLAFLWLWRRQPDYRRWLVGSVIVQLVLWFGIPGLTSKSFLTASNIAHNSPRACRTHKATCTVDRFTHLVSTPVWIAAAAALTWAAIRRQWALLLLAGGAVLWVVIEVVLAVDGLPAVPRYMFEAAAIPCVLAGVFVGRAVLDVPRFLSRQTARLSPSRLGGRIATLAGSWGAVVVVAAFAGSMLIPLHDQFRAERRDLTHERARAREFGRLQAVVDRLGQARIFACGQPNLPIGYQSVFAWITTVKTGQLYVGPKYYAHPTHPLVNFFPLGDGWRVFPSHVSAGTAAQRAACTGLRLTYRS